MPMNTSDGTGKPSWFNNPNSTKYPASSTAHIDKSSAQSSSTKKPTDKTSSYDPPKSQGRDVFMGAQDPKKK
ncbi:Exoglucanase 1 [Hypoxylon texense]